MKNLSKIVALTLSLFLLLPLVIGAAGNPDKVPGSLQYADTSFYVGPSGHNYFAILHGNANSNGGGFGTSNPLGTAKIGGLWPSVKALPLFELLAHDRTGGAFNPGKLISPRSEAFPRYISAKIPFLRTIPHPMCFLWTGTAREPSTITAGSSR